MAIPGAVPASMGRRLLAFVIDAVAALLVGGAFVAASLLPVLGAAGDPEGLEQALAGLVGPFALLGYGLVLVLALVQWWFLGTRGWTIGKYLVQLRAVSPETGRPVGMARALVRFLVPAAGSLVLGVGQLVVYLSPWWDAGGRRQGWHDKAAGTMVFDIGIGLDPTLLAPPDGTVSRRLDALMREGPPAEESPRIEVEPPVPALPPVQAAAFLPAMADAVPLPPHADDGDRASGRAGPTATAATVPGTDPVEGGGADGPSAPTAQESSTTAPEDRPWAPRPVFPSMLRDVPAEPGQVGAEVLQRRPPAPRAVFPSLRRQPADTAEQPVPQEQPDRVHSERPEQPMTVAPVPPPMSDPRSPAAASGMISAVPWTRPPEPAGADTAPTSSAAAPSSSGPVVGPSDPAQASSALVPPLLPDLPDEVEQTRLRPARGRVPEVPGPVPPTATLLMSDGRRVDFRGIALIGRDPTPRPGEDPDLLVRVADPGRSVSKTHLAVGTDRAGVWVADRDSTNGTVVTLADGQQILCGADQEVRLPEGASVSFGDYGFTVELCEDL